MPAAVELLESYNAFTTWFVAKKAEAVVQRIVTQELAPYVTCLWV